MALKEGDIPLDRKGARHVHYLSSGTDFGVRAAALDLGRALETQ